MALCLHLPQSWNHFGIFSSEKVRWNTTLCSYSHTAQRNYKHLKWSHQPGQILSLHAGSGGGGVGIGIISGVVAAIVVIAAVAVVMVITGVIFHRYVCMVIETLQIKVPVLWRSDRFLLLVTIYYMPILRRQRAEMSLLNHSKWVVANKCPGDRCWNVNKQNMTLNRWWTQYGI